MQQQPQQQSQQQPQSQQSMQPSHMDALNDVHEKIKWKQEREMCEQQAQQVQAQQQYEIRDPHGILYLIRSRL
jgi:hypothetical protein